MCRPILAVFFAATLISAAWAKPPDRCPNGFVWNQTTGKCKRSPSNSSWETIVRRFHKNPNTSTENQNEDFVHKVVSWAKSHPTIINGAVCVAAGAVTFIATKNPISAASMCTAAVAVTEAELHPKKFMHLAQEHPIITSAVTGLATGTAVFLVTKNPVSAVGVGLGVAGLTYAYLNHENLCPPPNPVKKPKPKKRHPRRKVAKKPATKASAPGSPPPSTKPTTKAPACADLEAWLATAQNQVQLCLGALQKSPAMQALIKNCEKYQKKGEAECAANIPTPSAPTLVSKEKSEGNPDLTPKILCSHELGKWQVRVFNLRKQIAETPSCQPPPSTGNTCPNGQMGSSGVCAPNGKVQAPPPPPPSNCNQSASAPTAGPDGQKGKNSTAKKADSGNKTASVDCGGQNQDKKSSWPKLPWKGMGLIGAYGGLLGALLLGPIGMFIFGLIGVGVGYLISQ